VHGADPAEKEKTEKKAEHSGQGKNGGQRRFAIGKSRKQKHGRRREEKRERERE
jgi:hypothetical protein